MDRPFQVIGHTLKGDPGTSALHLADLFGEIPDAFLPGDLIPNATRQSDFMDPSELVGLQDAPAYVKLPADIAIGTALNPLSYFSLGGAGAAARLGKVGQQANALAKAGGGFRAAMRDDDIVALLSRQLSRAGRRQLKAGQLDLTAMARQAQGDPSNLVDLVKGNDLFEQGGVRFAGRQIATPEAIAGKRDAVTGAIGRAAGAVGERLPDPVLEGLRRVRKGAEGMVQPFRSMMGYSNAGPMAAGRQRSIGRGAAAGRASDEAVMQAYEPLTPAERTAVGDILDGLRYDETGRPVGLLEGDIDQRLATLAEPGTIRPDVVRQALDSQRRISRMQLLEDIQEGAFLPDWLEKPLPPAQLINLSPEARTIISRAKSDPDYLRGLTVDDLPPDLPLGNENYLMRQFSGKKLEDRFGAVDELTGMPASLKARKLNDDESLLKFLQENPDVRMERDALKRARARAGQQGRQVTRGNFYREVLGPEANLSRPADRERMNQLVQTLRSSDPELSRIVENMSGGMAPRGAAETILSSANRPFKLAAVSGIFVPRVAGLTRNRGGGSWQTIDTEISTADNLKRVASDMVGAFADGIKRGFGVDLAKDELTRTLRLVDEAFATGGALQGVRRHLAKAGRDDLVAAVDNGVLDTFISTEGLVRRLSGKSKFWTKINDLMGMPGEMFQGVESRMRLASFMELLDKGYNPQAAAAIVKDAFLDYDVASVGNRRLRDIIPFAQFTTQTIPQQARLIGHKPYIGTGLAQLYGGEADEPVLPYIADQPSFRVGEDAEGNSLYASSLGIPVEALNVIPNLSASPFDAGRDIERNIVGSSHPLLKTLYGMTTGRDPFFGSDYGSYDKAPKALQALGADEHGEAGRLYNLLKGTGLTQPLVTPTTMLEQALDDRKPVAARLLNLLTGARIDSNDPDRAIQLILQDQLATDPTVRTYRTYYGGDDETDELLTQLREAKARLKEKREAREQADGVN